MEFNKSYVYFRRLPAMNQVVDQLKKWMDNQSR